MLSRRLESPSLRRLYLGFPPTLTGSVPEDVSDNILHGWVLPNLERLTLIGGCSSIAALFTFLSNMKALQKLVISRWYLINQFDKRLVYDEDEQQLQIPDGTLRSRVIWEIRKEIEEDVIPDVGLRLLQIEAKDGSVEATLSKPARTETVA